MSNLLLKNFKNKKVLITGHTGFKGAWLSLWLKMLDANVIGVALDPISNPTLYSEANIASDISDLRVDIRDHQNLEKVVKNLDPIIYFILPHKH